MPLVQNKSKKCISSGYAEMSLCLDKLIKAAVVDAF